MLYLNIGRRHKSARLSCYTQEYGMSVAAFPFQSGQPNCPRQLTFSDSRLKEYDDLEVMQMLGRAGRPQFDTAGVAVIMTKHENKEKYERMIAGTELVESW